MYVRKCVLTVKVMAKALYELYITNKTEHFSFKSRCVIWVARCLKEDLLVVLW